MLLIKLSEKVSVVTSIYYIRKAPTNNFPENRMKGNSLKLIIRILLVTIRDKIKELFLMNIERTLLNEVSTVIIQKDSRRISCNL